MKPVPLGLVLSGGGARGIAHAGVLRALDELGIRPGMISATSAGALVAALYADGMKPSAMPELLKNKKFFYLKGISFDLKGIMKADPFRHLLQNLHAATFEELKIPLVVNATDFNRAREVFFSSGPLVDPLVASCIIPVVFSPVVLHGHTLVDGGLLNNLPVEPLLEKCEKIVGVHVNPIEHHNTQVPLTRVLERCFHMAISNTIPAKASRCDVFIEPPELSKYGVFDFEYATEMARIGYEATMARRDDLLALHR